MPFSKNLVTRNICVLAGNEDMKHFKGCKEKYVKTGYI